MPGKIKLRYILLATIIIIAVIIAISDPEDTQIDADMSACKILEQHPKWKASLRLAKEKYKLPPAYAMGLIYQESRFQAEAKSKYSSAYGYAQVIDGTWKHFQKDIKQNAKRNNFNDSVQFIGWYTAQLAASTKLKMTDSENLYMAYMLGPTGFKRYKAGTFKNKEKIKEDKKIAEKVKHITKLYGQQLKKCKI